MARSAGFSRLLCPMAQPSPHDSVSFGCSTSAGLCQLLGRHLLFLDRNICSRASLCSIIIVPHYTHLHPADLQGAKEHDWQRGVTVMPRAGEPLGCFPLRHHLRLQHVTSGVSLFSRDC